MSKAQCDALIHHIQSTQCVGDLISWLAIIPFSEIQNFVEQQIVKLNQNSIRKAYFSDLSINDTLPSDIVRHILSFNTFPHNAAINATNKQWKKCSAQIKAKQNKERQQAVDSYHIKYDEEVNNIWIVDKNRSLLTDDEIASNFKGPVSDLHTAIERCESGDKLLIHDGVYEEPQMVTDKSIQLVGVGDSVVVRMRNTASRDIVLTFQNNSISYVENIAFPAYDKCDDGPIEIVSNAKVTLHRCKFENGMFCIYCADGGCLDIKSCEFINCNCGIYAEHDAEKVNVIGCRFENDEKCEYTNSDNFGYPVLVYCEYKESSANTAIRKDTVHLRCIGNVFRNNLSFPFAKICSHDDVKQLSDWNTYSLRYNMLEGDKSIFIKGKLVDANGMYIKFG
eukprot:457050_1